ncbi:hypothetical protein QYE76_036261 [Lolium multiflorum]|uniref:Uncharacterized protein n=1 Tax=Lolium multiflorum TaxID=4521 RepID=A0AAD8VQ00_LOLMU|nr:hypothetical protein QYE76_036261 [Lolium multiflorum]
MDTPRPRKPLVATIGEQVATGFLVGGVLGAAYHLAKGGFQAVCKNVPRGSCSTAVFFGVYAAIDYAVVSARRKEEPVLDGAVAMGGAYGITSLHKGLRYAGQSALVGAAFGGAVMGGLSLLEDWTWDLSPPAQHADDEPGHPAPAFRPTLPVEVPWTPPVGEEIRN